MNAHGLLSRAAARRLARALPDARIEMCWANILPPGASYGEHTHNTPKPVAVWCLTDDVGALHIEPDTVVPDRAGRLIIFPGDLRHWVPTVERERITVAMNLTE